jgi:PAS domain S-box-containing protein
MPYEVTPVDSQKQQQTSGASKLMEEVVSDCPIDNKAFSLLAKAAFSKVVSACKFSVTIADPAQPETPLIAVSTRFEEMTGYSRDEIIGKNCRFLNFDCKMDFDQRSQIRESSQTGKPCMFVLENRRKNGEIFVNLLDMRGLRIAKNTATNEDIWYLVGIQSDVTELVDLAAYEGDAAAAISDSHKAQLHMIADYMRDELKKELAARAVGVSMQQSPLAALHGVEAKETAGYPFRLASLGDLSTMDQLDNFEGEEDDESREQSDLEEWSSNLDQETAGLSSRQTTLSDEAPQYNFQEGPRSRQTSDEASLHDFKQGPQQKAVLPSVVLVQDPEWL